MTEKQKLVLGNDRKHYGKRRKCWLPTFSPFPIIFSINLFPNKPWFICFTCLQCKFSENTMEKGEISRYEQFLLFPQFILPIWITFYHFHYNLYLSSANSFSLEESKTCRLGKG